MCESLIIEPAQIGYRIHKPITLRISLLYKEAIDPSLLGLIESEFGQIREEAGIGSASERFY